jgi:hypothetical protein
MQEFKPATDTHRTLICIFSLLAFQRFEKGIAHEGQHKMHAYHIRNFMFVATGLATLWSSFHLSHNTGRIRFKQELNRYIFQ